jgi:hypothetical protein
VFPARLSVDALNAQLDPIKAAATPLEKSQLHWRWLMTGPGMDHARRHGEHVAALICFYGEHVAALIRREPHGE